MKQPSDSRVNTQLVDLIKVDWTPENIKKLRKAYDESLASADEHVRFGEHIIHHGYVSHLLAFYEHQNK